MNRIVLVVILILCLTIPGGFAMTVPSDGAQEPVICSPESGGSDIDSLSEEEMVLIIVGAVCGTVILLSIID